MDSEENPWKTLSAEVIYDNPWIEVSHREVINPGGKAAMYGVVHFKNLALGILPLDENYNTWVVGQYRYPIDQYTWEIPEGGGDLEIDPLESAQRELREEAGIIARQWDLIQEMYLSNSATTEKALLYVARDLEFVEPDPDEDEVLQLHKIPFDELYQWVLDGKVNDSLTVTTVLKAKLMMENGEL